MSDIKKNDLAAILGKGLLGVIPILGPLLSEIAGNLIPNQRIDRIASELEILESKIENIGETLDLMKPEFAEVYYNRGAKKVHQGKYEDAICNYDKAIRLNSEFAEAYNDRGVAESELSHHAEAVLDFDKAINFKIGFCRSVLQSG